MGPTNAAPMSADHLVEVVEGRRPVPVDAAALADLVVAADRIGMLWRVYLWQLLLIRFDGDEVRARVVWDAACGCGLGAVVTGSGDAVAPTNAAL